MDQASQLLSTTLLSNRPALSRLLIAESADHKPRAPLTSIGDWKREFSELVRRGVGEPGEIAGAASEQAVENDVPASDADPDQALAGRRLSLAARLVQLGFIAAIGRGRTTLRCRC